MDEEHHCSVKVKALSHHHQGADCLEATTQHSVQGTKELHTNQSSQGSLAPTAQECILLWFCPSEYIQKRTSAQGHHCDFFFSLLITYSSDQ